MYITYYILNNEFKLQASHGFASSKKNLSNLGLCDTGSSTLQKTYIILTVDSLKLLQPMHECMIISEENAQWRI